MFKEIKRSCSNRTKKNMAVFRISKNGTHILKLPRDFEAETVSIFYDHDNGCLAINKGGCFRVGRSSQVAAVELKDIIKAGQLFKRAEDSGGYDLVLSPVDG